MRLRGCVLGVAVATMLVVLPSLGRPVRAGEATDHVRTHIDQMYQLVAKTGSTADSREAVQKLADRMFNWNAMAEGALGQHWRERTPPERAEFVRLFAEVFERAYLSKIQLADAERFAYLGDTTKDDHAVVRTRITTNNGTVIPVNYRARMTEGGTWRVYDLDVGGVSLVGNYRTQFNSIIGRSSYPALVNRLKALREQHGGVRSTTIPRSTYAECYTQPDALWIGPSVRSGVRRASSNHPVASISSNSPRARDQGSTGGLTPARQDTALGQQGLPELGAGLNDRPPPESGRP